MFKIIQLSLLITIFFPSLGHGWITVSDFRDQLKLLLSKVDPQTPHLNPKSCLKVVETTSMKNQCRSQLVRPFKKEYNQIWQEYFFDAEIDSDCSTGGQPLHKKILAVFTPFVGCYALSKTINCIVTNTLLKAYYTFDNEQVREKISALESYINEIKKKLRCSIDLTPSNSLIARVRDHLSLCRDPNPYKVTYYDFGPTKIDKGHAAVSIRDHEGSIIRYISWPLNNSFQDDICSFNSWQKKLEKKIPLEKSFCISQSKLLTFSDWAEKNGYLYDGEDQLQMTKRGMLNSWENVTTLLQREGYRQSQIDSLMDRSIDFDEARPIDIKGNLAQTTNILRSVFSNLGPKEYNKISSYLNNYYVLRAYNKRIIQRIQERSETDFKIDKNIAFTRIGQVLKYYGIKENPRRWILLHSRQTAGAKTSNSKNNWEVLWDQIPKDDLANQCNEERLGSHFSKGDQDKIDSFFSKLEEFGAIITNNELERQRRRDELRNEIDGLSIDEWRKDICKKLCLQISNKTKFRQYFMDYQQSIFDLRNKHGDTVRSYGKGYDEWSNNCTDVAVQSLQVLLGDSKFYRRSIIPRTPYLGYQAISKKLKKIFSKEQTGADRISIPVYDIVPPPPPLTIPYSLL